MRGGGPGRVQPPRVSLCRMENLFINRFMHMFQSSWNDFADFEKIFVRISNTISGECFGALSWCWASLTWAWERADPPAPVRAFPVPEAGTACTHTAPSAGDHCPGQRFLLLGCSRLNILNLIPPSKVLKISEFFLYINQSFCMLLNQKKKKGRS